MKFSSLLISSALLVTALGCQQSKPQVSEKMLERYQRYCSKCHDYGVAGAPQKGDAAAWAERLRKGKDQLLKSTKDGMPGMPPMGECVQCTNRDFYELIDHLVRPPTTP